MGNSINGKKQQQQNVCCGKKDLLVARKEFELLAFGFNTSCISNKKNIVTTTTNNSSSCNKTLHLPCKSMIREIVSGGNFTIFRTFSNKLFIKHIGESKITSQKGINISGNVTRFKYQKLNYQKKHNDQLWGDNLKRLNYKTAKTELEEIYCSNHSICLRMKDDSLIFVDDYSQSVLSVDDFKSRNELKCIFSGPLASTFIFVNNRNQVDLCQHKECSPKKTKHYEPFTLIRNVPLPDDIGPFSIVKGVCGAEKSFLILEDLIDGTHQLCSYNEKSQRFEVLSTHFQGERIQDISCGYRHMALIMECGDVFISNSTSDISFKLIQFPLFPFIKLNEPPKRRSNPNRKQVISKDPYALIYERDQLVGSFKPFIPHQVLCSSLATFFLNEKGCIILGQPCNDVTPTFLFDDGSSAFYHAFDEDGSVANSEISVGGWHFSFHQTRLISKTSLCYFQSNLRSLTNSNDRSDIEIICHQ